MLRPLLLVPVLALLLTAMACGDSEPPDFSEDVPADAARVDMDGLKFLPNELMVDAGTTVYFTNSESAPHTVDFEDESSGNMARGDVFAWTFEEAGEYEITCEYHPQMRATITVE